MLRMALLFLALASLLASLVGCGPATPSAPIRAPGQKIRVFAPNPALASMVRDLGGDEVELVTPWEGAGDPAYWRPTPEAIRQIQSCDVIVLNGAAYEPWAAQAALPRARTVDTTAGVRKQLIEVAGETHSHGPEGEHTHATTASTTWLSPALARAQAEAIAGALKPFLTSDEARSEFMVRKTTLLAMLTRAEEALAGLKASEPKWLASHPVYQYLGQAAGIEIESKHWEPGEMPDEKEWTKFRLTRAAFPKPTAWMLWEGEPGPEIRAQLEKEGVRVAVVPLFPSADGEFAKSYAILLERMVEELGRR